jgi:hypothetical protein
MAPYSTSGTQGGYVWTLTLTRVHIYMKWIWREINSTQVTGSRERLITLRFYENNLADFNACRGFVIAIYEFPSCKAQGKGANASGWYWCALVFCIVCFFSFCASGMTACDDPGDEDEDDRDSNMLFDGVRREDGILIDDGVEDEDEDDDSDILVNELSEKTAKNNNKTLLTGLFIFLWFSFSLSLSFFNKWLYGMTDFKYPLFTSVSLYYSLSIFLSLFSLSLCLSLAIFSLCFLSLFCIYIYLSFSVYSL